MLGPAASGPTSFTPAVRSARSPCQAIRGPAAACPVEALPSQITPPETLAAGGWEGWRAMLTYIHHAATGAAVFKQSAMKIPEKILATRSLPPDVSSML